MPRIVITNILNNTLFILRQMTEEQFDNRHNQGRSEYFDISIGYEVEDYISSGATFCRKEIIDEIIFNLLGIDITSIKIDLHIQTTYDNYKQIIE